MGRRSRSGRPRFDALEHVFAHLPRSHPGELPHRRQEMARNEFRFFRGSVATFYELWSRRARGSPSPAVWVCGDAHWENIGSYRGKNRIAYFDLTDFDHACLAPIDVELGRALTAYHAAGLAKLAPTFLAGYHEALIGGKPRHIEREVAKGSIRRLLQTVARRKRKRFIRERTSHDRIVLGDGQTCAVPRGERAQAMAVFRRWAAGRRHREFFRVVDLCGSLSGVGSLGLRRYLVLVEGGKRRHLIDMKEAVPSALAPFSPRPQPKWSCEAERIATVQAYIQYEPIAHLGWLRDRTSSFVLSDFQPAEDRIDSDLLAPDVDGRFARKWGRLLAWAHLRSAGWRRAATIDDLMTFGRELDQAASGGCSTRPPRSAGSTAPPSASFADFRDALRVERRSPLSKRWWICFPPPPIGRSSTDCPRPFPRWTAMSAPRSR